MFCTCFPSNFHPLDPLDPLDPLYWCLYILIRQGDVLSDADRLLMSLDLQVYNFVLFPPNNTSAAWISPHSHIHTLPVALHPTICCCRSCR